MSRPLAALALLAFVAACGGEDELMEADSAPDVLADPEKADVASAVTISGGLTLEDSTSASLPAVPKYVGFIVLAPAGAKLQVSASGGALATKVTLYGPRAANGSFGSAIATGISSAKVTIPRDGAYLAVPQPRYQQQSGKATVAVSCTGTSCRGYCAATTPSLQKRTWDHSIATPVTTAAGKPNHRAYDQVVAPGTRPTLRARFTYGGVDKDLEDETVDLWVRTCPGWQKLASVRTDEDGFAEVALPSSLSPGDYKLIWHVPGDNSTADGTLAVWERNRQFAVSDIDGTLTTNDGQIFQQVFLGNDPQQYADADGALWLARRHGFRIQYLTGRPESLGRMTKAWLVSHRFPPGPVRLTDETLEALPTESGVGDFKTRILNGLRNDVGATIFAGFGNATTDISAYQANGIANDHLFIIGPHAGERGTTAVASYGAILAKLRAWPYAAIP